MKRKWFRRKGVVVVNENNGVSEWKVSGKVWKSSAAGRSLQAEVETSAGCHARKRRILIYVEVSQEKVHLWRDLVTPLGLSFLIAGVAGLLTHVATVPDMARMSLTALFYGSAATLALGHAGWVLGRAFGRAQRLHPMGKTVLQQHWKLVAGIVTFLVSASILSLVMQDQSSMGWAVDVYAWCIHPWGAAAQFLGLGWLSFGIMAWEVLRGFTASRLLVAFNGVAQQQYRADRPRRSQFYSWWQWRVDLADFECPSAPCATHPAQPDLQPMP